MKKQHRKRTAMAITLLALSASPIALGQESPPSGFSIQAQPLSTALDRFSKWFGLQVGYESDLVAGLTSRGTIAVRDPRQALEAILAGTDLQYQFVNEQTVVIKAAERGNNRSGQTSGDDKKVDSSLLEEIMVTAEKREESLQTIPIAISAVSGETMTSAGVKGMGDLNQLVPSLQFGTGIQPRVSIRGIGSELNNIGNEAGVTIAQDGLPFSNHYMFEPDFFDVERVEVLRGPQGTISGRNATGGAINIYSKRPTEEFEGALKATIGNFLRFETEGNLSGPILDGKLLGRLAFRTERADGWLKNTFRDEEHNNADKVNARLSLLANLSDHLDAYLILEGRIDRSSPVSVLDFGRARPDMPGFAESRGIAGFDRDKLEYQADFPDITRIEDYKGILKLTWDITQSATLTSITSYASFDSVGKDDFDGTIVASQEFSRTEVNLWQLSEELTLTADLSDRLDVILGALYLQANAYEPLLMGFPLVGLPTDSYELRSDQDLTSYAAYTQWRYRLTDNIRVSIGGRYTYDSKDVTESRAFFGGSPTAQSDSKSWSAFTPRAALDYTPTDDLTLYASASRGFKAGGFNTFDSLSSKGEFNPEFVWNYEAGVKASWLDRRLRTALTGFYMDYTDLQQGVFRPDPGTATGVNSSVENAGAATVAGVELELEMHVTNALEITAAGTWLDATFDELLTNDNILFELGQRDLAGNKLARAPEFQFSLSGEYTVPLGGNWQCVLRADYRWQEEIFFTFFNHQLDRQDAYGLLNLFGAIETEDGRWQVSAYIRNLLDQRYVSDSRAGPAVSPDVVVGRFGRVGAPRQYALGLAYRF